LASALALGFGFGSGSILNLRLRVTLALPQRSKRLKPGRSISGNVVNKVRKMP
jgi:hypothetical protein